MLGLSSSTSNNHSPFSRSHLFTRNNEHTFISCGHAGKPDIHQTQTFSHRTGRHAEYETALQKHTQANRGMQSGTGGGSACMEAHVPLTDANVIKRLGLFLASAEVLKGAVAR